MFAICSIVAEFIPGGGVVPYYFINPIRLIHSSGTWGNFIYFCEFRYRPEAYPTPVSPRPETALYSARPSIPHLPISVIILGDFLKF